MNAHLSYKVIPVLVINEVKHAKGIGETLLSSGLPVIELTLRTDSSWDSFQELRKIDGLQLGVGSIKSAGDMKRAVDLGADFTVSPGLLPEVATVAIEANIPYYPGVATPSEMMQGIALGLTTLKFFPAESLGGISTLDSMSAPFRDLSFIPTGGIDLKSLPKYLQSKKVTAVGGSWLVPQSIVDNGEYEKIRQLTIETLGVIRQSKDGNNAEN
jgi:2-dehydro-3-deoxyphosphogluconate aldolase/(4S)-4-hydroxy-2-oxoglutarate aldolase